MNIIILTQNDPFYLAENISYLISKIPSHSRIVGCVVFSASVFGKKETMFQKAVKTYRVFGLNYFIRYGFTFIKNKFDSRKKVLKVLRGNSIPIISLPDYSINSLGSLNIIRKYKPDLLISIGGNQVFKRPLIDLAAKGCLNLHTALLPRYRGLMPTFWVLKNNEKFTGVSVFFVDEGIDSGPILVQNKIEIGDRTQKKLIECTKKMGMEAIVESIELIEKGGYKLIENDDSQMTYFKFPTKQDVKEFLRSGKRFY